MDGWGRVEPARRGGRAPTWLGSRGEHFGFGDVRVVPETAGVGVERRAATTQHARRVQRFEDPRRDGAVSSRENKKRLQRDFLGRARASGARPRLGFAPGRFIHAPAKYITGKSSCVLQLWLPRYTSSPSRDTAAARDRDNAAVVCLLHFASACFTARASWRYAATMTASLVFETPHVPTSVGVSTSVSVTTRAVVVIVAMGGNRSACRVVNGGSSARFLPPPSVKKGTRTPPYVRGARVETSARARCVDGKLNARKVLGENSIALRVGVCRRKTNGAGC